MKAGLFMPLLRIEIFCLKLKRNSTCNTAQKKLMKLTPGVDFTHVLLQAFMLADPKSAKKTDGLTVFLRFWNLRM